MHSTFGVWSGLSKEFFSSQAFSNTRQKMSSFIKQSLCYILNITLLKHLKLLLKYSNRKLPHEDWKLILV